MRKESKTENVNFRVSLKMKKWLDKISEEGTPQKKTITEFLNEQIFNRTNFFILEKAINRSKIIVGKEFGIPEKVALVINEPERIFSLVGEEKKAKFKGRWVEEFKKEYEKLTKEFDMRAMEEHEITEWVFDSHVQFKLISSALYERQEPVNKQTEEGG